MLVNGVILRRVDLMRCTACGEGMALTAVVQDEILPPQWFARHALACFGCERTERKLVFTRGLSAIARGEEPQAVPAPPPPPRVEPEPPPPPAIAIAAAPAWMRAVEKLRSRQAELDQRADALKKANWTVRFNEAWEKLAPSHREPPPAPEAPAKRRELPATSGRVLRARLRKTTPPLAHSRPEPQPGFVVRPNSSARSPARVRSAKFLGPQPSSGSFGQIPRPEPSSGWFGQNAGPNGLGSFRQIES